MTDLTVEFVNIPGTEAAMGWAGAHTLVTDRPDGVAGGQGLGFNGGQLLALALGGCLCNDIRYVADARGARVGEIAVGVTLSLAGKPLIVTGAKISVRMTMADGSDPREVFDAACADSTVSNSVDRGFPVAFALRA